MSGSKIKYSIPAVKKAISKLRERGVLLSHCRGKGRICPLFFSNQEHEPRRIKDIEATFSWKDVEGKPSDNIQVVVNYAGKEGITDLVKRINTQDVIDDFLKNA